MEKYAWVQRECLWCHIKFEAKLSQVKRGQHTYCSRRCYGDHKISKTQRPKTQKCKQCGVSFFSYPSRIKRGGGQWCSKQCADIGRKRKWPQRLCRVCGSFAFDKGQKKYCSKGCALIAAKSQREVDAKCQVCGIEFKANLYDVLKGMGVFCSHRCMGHSRSQANNGLHNGKRSKGGKREDLNNVYFRSTWEANYARYLNWLVSLGAITSWEYEPRVFIFPVKRGNTSYTPDFRVIKADGSYSWHEIKGWMDATSKTKLKRMAKYYPEEPITILGQKEYYAIAREVKGFIPGWELCAKKSI